MFFQNLLDEITELVVEVWELLDHDEIYDPIDLLLHDLVNPVVDGIGGRLKFFEQGVDQGQEGIYGWETGDGGVSCEIDHGLFDVLVMEVSGGWLFELLLVDLGQLASDF